MGRLSFFIIGMPRSGTKLLRELLNNHMELFVPEVETLFIPSLLNNYKNKILTESEIKKVTLELKKSLFFFYYLEDNKFDFDKLIVVPNQCTIIDYIDNFYNELTLQRKIKVNQLGDKSPNYIHSINLLLEYYPQAKFIHIVRDPRDYALSVRNAWKKSMKRAIFNWVKGINKLHDFANKNPNKILQIKYEDLIVNPKQTLTKCTEFLDVEYEENMSQLKRSIENLGDAQSAEVQGTNHQKYLSKLSNNEIKMIESYTVEFLRAYKYPYSIKKEKNKAISKILDTYLKISDGLNLIVFNCIEHGIKKGLHKMVKAIKHV